MHASVRAAFVVTYVQVLRLTIENIKIGLENDSVMWVVSLSIDYGISIIIDGNRYTIFNRFQTNTSQKMCIFYR